MVDSPKVEFAVGSEVSAASFYKSAFARAFAMNSRETKSLDFGFMNNETIDEEPECNATTDTKNNNFISFTKYVKQVNSSDLKLWSINEITTDNSTAVELEKLRKECQSLTDENRRLQNSQTVGQMSQSRIVDSVLLQNQVDTLQWQLKQTEANRQMYRALMEQIVRFLDRAHKSLDILHEKHNPKSSKVSRVPRSRSVHAVDTSSPSRASGPTSASFARAKSVTQISPTSNAIRDFTWSVLRRSEAPTVAPPVVSESPEVTNETQEGVVVYRRRPKQSESNPDEIPPERLSQEAFRLMRTAQSLLSTREPDLVRTIESDDNPSPSPCDQDLSLPPNFANSNIFHDSSFPGCASSSDRGSSGTDNGSSCSFRKSTTNTESNGVCLLPGARRSLDATSLHSGSSKTTEEDDAGPRSLLSSGALDREFPGTPTSSTPNRHKKTTETEVRFRPKPATSISSAEDESGFSSMSSFQDVGLPSAPSPVKGCHTEVGLPEVPLPKVKHRRWSSTPAEMQALINGRHNASFSKTKTTNESLKVLWV